MNRFWAPKIITKKSMKFLVQLGVSFRIHKVDHTCSKKQISNVKITTKQHNTVTHSDTTLWVNTYWEKWHQQETVVQCERLLCDFQFCEAVFVFGWSLQQFGNHSQLFQNLPSRFWWSCWQPYPQHKAAHPVSGPEMKIWVVSTSMQQQQHNKIHT